MEGLHRRASGVYVARLVVPERLRHLVGQRELIASTGVRDRAVAVVVGSAVLAAWRRRLHDLDALLGKSVAVDVLKVVAGSPVLTGGGYLPIREAAAACGIEPLALLREAAGGRLELFFRSGGVPGVLVPFTELQRDPDGTCDVTGVHRLADAEQVSYQGMLRLQEAPAVANAILGGSAAVDVLFGSVEHQELGFVPDGRGIGLTIANLEVKTSEVEALRRDWAATVSAEQIELAKLHSSGTRGVVGGKGAAPVSAAVDAYMEERSKSCKADQARRIRAALDLFVELEGDPVLEQVDRDRLRQYRDKVLPTVPANENKVRLTHGTRSVSESIQAVTETEWPSLSTKEQLKRMEWLAGMFGWLRDEQWIADDPAARLASVRRRAGDESRDQDARDLFTPDELKLIFSAQWFLDGKGVLTKAGTYREFMPSHYWVPLLALFTGARANELCQLLLDDVSHTTKGTVFLDINQAGERKSLKNTHSARRVPVHPVLVKLGFESWCSRLREEGFTRVFPELSYTEGKGYAVMFIRWFSAYLERLGMPRDGRKSLHSFRHVVATELHNGGHPEPLVNELLGHKRGEGEGRARYRKEAAPDKLAPIVRGLNFDLPPIEAFDQEAGVKAIRDALARKNRGSGATEG